MNRIAFLLFFLCYFSNAQNDTYLEGKVIATGNSKEGINVYNKTTLNGTTTNLDGYFSVKANVQDTILFSSISYEMKQLIVTEGLLNQEDITIQLIPIIYKLDEVIVKLYDLTGTLEYDMANNVKKNGISASGLGLPNANVPLMSYSERKIYTLSNHDGVLISLLNNLSGRTKRNNKIITVIRKQDLVDKVRSSFEDSLFVNSLKIPQHKIDGFMYFCEADSVFQKIAQEGSKFELWKFFLQKSIEFKNITP